MQVLWKYGDKIRGIGHGVEFELVGFKTDRTVGFIEGYGWNKEPDSKVTVHLDQRLKDFPVSLTTELQLAILLFLTDKKRQHDGEVIEGFKTHFNA